MTLPSATHADPSFSRRAPTVRARCCGATRRLLALALASVVTSGTSCTSNRSGPPPEPPPLVEAVRETEGMWLPDAPPAEHLRRRFGFELTPAWAEHVRLASVNVGGASGAFVSADGLVLTNHHVVSGGIQSVSTPERDLLRDGFLARARGEEVRLPGSELSVLLSTEDVTDRVQAAVPAGLPDDQAAKRRQAAIAEIERAAKGGRADLRCRVVELYGGARYHLYRSKVYADVRLVFAPEQAVAFFGGDPDNFEFPRYDLDVAFVRAYEDGQPAKVDHWLTVTTSGVADGDLVFVSGHPGRTDRLLPSASLEADRETGRLSLRGRERSERALLDYSARGPEQARRAASDLFGVQNGLKAGRPRQAFLEHGRLIEHKRQEEQRARAMAAERADVRPLVAAWDRIGAAAGAERRLFPRLLLLEWGAGLQSDLFRHARTIVRLADDRAKPDAERLPDYTDARRDQTERRLLADRPVYADLEVAKLTASLEFMRDTLGAADPTVAAVLAGKPPAERAAELVAGSRLADAGERRLLVEGGAAAVAASNDAMIRLARQVDAEARAIRAEHEAAVEEPLAKAMADVGRVRFALAKESSVYPDATGTLRLAFGRVAAYAEDDGTPVPPWTTVGGTFDHAARHGNVDPWRLPQSWHAARSALRGETPLNFVATADITGGNSGSPTINRAGELVGVIFDSNRQALTNSFAYDDRQGRCVSVDARAVVECLRAVYKADALLAEIGAK